MVWHSYRQQWCSPYGQKLWIIIQPDRQSAQKVNDYMVDAYVCQQSACSSVGIWNVYRNMRDKLPCTNNDVKEHNFRMFIIFPYRLHTYAFIGHLKDKHEF